MPPFHEPSSHRLRVALGNLVGEQPQTTHNPLPSSMSEHRIKATFQRKPKLRVTVLVSKHASLRGGSTTSGTTTSTTARKFVSHEALLFRWRQKPGFKPFPIRLLSTLFSMGGIET